MWIEFQIEDVAGAPLPGVGGAVVDHLCRLESDGMSFTAITPPAVVDQGDGTYGFKIPDVEVIDGTHLAWRVDCTVAAKVQFVIGDKPVNSPDTVIFHPMLVGGGGPYFGAPVVFRVMKTVAPDGTVTDLLSTLQFLIVVPQSAAIFGFKMDNTYRVGDAVFAWGVTIDDSAEDKYPAGEIWLPSLASPPAPAAPTITNMKPTPPGPLSSGTPISFDVNGNVAELLVWVSYADIPLVEMAYDGSSFTAAFSGGSTIAGDDTVTNVVIKRGAGWPGAPRLTVRARTVAGGVNA